MHENDPAIQRLLQSSDPSIRYFTLIDLTEVRSTFEVVDGVDAGRIK
jgi:hypothetical protein